MEECEIPLQGQKKRQNRVKEVRREIRDVKGHWDETGKRRSDGDERKRSYDD